MKRYIKVGFKKLEEEEYEFLLEKRAIARKKGNFQLDERLRAVILVGYERLKQKEAARMCETHPRNLSRWLALYRKSGYEELANFKYKGKPAELNREQLARLDEIVDAAPRQWGYDSGTWTAGMVVEVIFKEFGVKYSNSAVQKILRKLGFSFKLAKKNSPGQTRGRRRSGWMKNCRESSNK